MSRSITVTVDDTGEQRQFTAQEGDGIVEAILEFVNYDTDDLAENYPGALAMIRLIDPEPDEEDEG